MDRTIDLSPFGLYDWWLAHTLRLALEIDLLKDAGDLVRAKVVEDALVTAELRLIAATKVRKAHDAGASRSGDRLRDERTRGEAKPPMPAEDPPYRDSADDGY